MENGGKNFFSLPQTDLPYRKRSDEAKNSEGEVPFDLNKLGYCFFYPFKLRVEVTKLVLLVTAYILFSKGFETPHNFGKNDGRW